MREQENQADEYRYHIQPIRAASSENPEEEINQYYGLIRLKLAPRKLFNLSIFNVLLVLGVILCLGLASLFMTKPTESAIEKRQLAKMPAFSKEALFSGEYTRGIETFYADTFPFRDFFVALSAYMEENSGVRMDDARILAPSPNESTDPITGGAPPVPSSASSTAPEGTSLPAQQEPAEQQDAASSQPSAAENTDVDDGITGSVSNGIFVYKGRAMSLFGGSKENGKWYADVLNLSKQQLPDVKIYDMIIPTAIEFYVPDKYADLTQPQKPMIDYIYSCLAPSIKRVDAYSKLQEHAEEYIYFRTDHHWTGLGAYYAYTAFCEQAGLSALPVSDFETRRLDNFIGTMYAQSKDSTLLGNPDYVDYYVFNTGYTARRYDYNAPYYGIPHTLWGEYAQSPNSYSVFLHGDFPLIQVKTDIHNGKKILVVKESFGNAFAPFLINHYEEVYIVDQRYFQLNLVEFIKENEIGELIFANNSFAACTPYHISHIDNMRFQTFVPYVPEEEEQSPDISESEEEYDGGIELRPYKKKEDDLSIIYDD